ncbi:hypothetical protein N9D56_01095 [Methylophilaceae bacterium]|nr:hypothetical protein [Methylophilaceae bacterium]
MTNQILKRFSNIFAILVLLIFFGIAYLFKDILDQSSIKGIGFIVFMFGYALSLLIVGLLNYIFFGYFAFWHSGIGINEKLEKQHDQLRKEKQSFLIPFYLGFKNDFFTHAILNILRGLFAFIFWAAFIFFIAGIIHYFGWQCAFRDETCDPNSYINIFDFLILVNLNYYVDIFILFLIGFFLRYDDSVASRPMTKITARLEHSVHKRYEDELYLIGEGSRVSDYHLLSE